MADNVMSGSIETSLAGPPRMVEGVDDGLSGNLSTSRTFPLSSPRPQRTWMQGLTGRLLVTGSADVSATVDWVSRALLPLSCPCLAQFLRSVI